MNNQIKDLTYSAIILGMMITLSVIQIPLTAALSLDFSFIPLLIGRRFIGLYKSLILCFIFSWFTMFIGDGGLPGALFLMIQSLALVLIDYVIMKDKVYIIGIIATIILMTIISVVLNVFVIAPMWWGTYSSYYSNFWENSSAFWISAIWFNPLKFILVYSVAYFLLPALVKERGWSND